VLFGLEVDEELEVVLEELLVGERAEEFDDVVLFVGEQCQ